MPELVLKVGIVVYFLLIVPVAFVMPEHLAWENGPLEILQNIVLFCDVVLCIVLFRKTAGQRFHKLWLAVSGYFLLLFGREISWGRIFFQTGMDEHGPTFISMSSVPGHQYIHGGISIYVDYAHTPDALEKAIASVSALETEGKTIVVFGCGGDRDSGKRPIMGRAALAADYAVVTSDNPRTEDPNAIIEDIVAGMGEGTDHFEVVPDRRDAIARAIAVANPGDAILIAGKGHEDYQIIGTEKHHFDDREVAAEELKKVFG